WWQTVLGKIRAYEAGDTTRQSNDRLVRLFVKLGQEDEPRLNRLFTRVQQARSIERAMQIINSSVHFGGPQLAFYRDTAEFDTAEWQGGWSRNLQGAELRDAQRAWFETARRWDRQVRQEAELADGDRTLGAQLLMDPVLDAQ